jgi:hypothetical protein
MALIRIVWKRWKLHAERQGAAFFLEKDGLPVKHKHRPTVRRRFRSRITDDAHELFRKKGHVFP